jgi:hypothetical protein
VLPLVAVQNGSHYLGLSLAAAQGRKHAQTMVSTRSMGSYRGVNQLQVGAEQSVASLGCCQSWLGTCKHKRHGTAAQMHGCESIHQHSHRLAPVPTYLLISCLWTSTAGSSCASRLLCPLFTCLLMTSAVQACVIACGPGTWHKGGGAKQMCNLQSISVYMVQR